MTERQNGNSQEGNSPLLARRLQFGSLDYTQPSAPNDGGSAGDAVSGRRLGKDTHPLTGPKRNNKRKQRTWKPMDKCNMGKLEYSDHTAIRRKNFVDLVKEVSLDFGAKKGTVERTTKDMIDALQSASEAHLIETMHWAGEACKHARKKRTQPRDYGLLRKIKEREQHQYYNGTKL